MNEPRAIPHDHLDVVVKLIRRSLRYLWVVALTLLLGIGASVGALKLRHPKFQSGAVLYYQEGLSWTLNGGEGGGGKKVGARLKEVLLARAQLQKVIEELNLFPRMVKAGKTSEAVEELHQAVTFKVNEGDTYVITYQGDSPEEAQLVTAKLTELLIGENTRLRAEQAEVAKGFLDAEAKRNENNLREKETELARFLQKHTEFAQEQAGSGAAVRATTKKGVDPATLTGDTVLTALRREEERLRHQITSPSAVPVHAPADPALVSAKNEADAKLAAAKRDLADKRARYTDQHPDVRAAEALVRDAQSQQARAAEALKAAEQLPSEVVEIEPKAALEARLAQVQQEIHDYQEKKKRTTTPDEPAETNDAAQRIVAVETEWTRLNREVAEARERFQQLDTKQFMATMAASSLAGGQTAQILVIDPAYTPSKPIGLSTARFVIVGVGVAFGLGVGLALLLGLLDDRLLDRADLEKLGLVPVLIEVPLRARRMAAPRKPTKAVTKTQPLPGLGKQHG